MDVLRQSESTLGLQLVSYVADDKGLKSTEKSKPSFCNIQKSHDHVSHYVNSTQSFSLCEFDDDDKLGKLKYSPWKSQTRTTAKLISAATSSLNVHQPVATTANTNDYF